MTGMCAQGFKQRNTQIKADETEGMGRKTVINDVVTDKQMQIRVGNA